MTVNYRTIFDKDLKRYADQNTPVTFDAKQAVDLIALGMIAGAALMLILFYA